jgi:hypothetical protein
MLLLFAVSCYNLLWNNGKYRLALIREQLNNQIVRKLYATLKGGNHAG